MPQKIAGFLAYSDWEDVEESAVVAIEDRSGAQIFRDFSAEWIAHEKCVRIVINWASDKPPAAVKLDAHAVDVIAECSLKFCAMEAAANAWLQTQLPA